MKHSKTGLFLMELIVGILFFALAGALCVQLFVKANTMNEESICKDQGMRIAANIVEVYKNDKTNDLVNEGIVYFDDFGQAVDKKDATRVSVASQWLRVCLRHRGGKLWPQRKSVRQGGSELPPYRTLFTASVG